jgi:hypothetical protein
MAKVSNAQMNAQLEVIAKMLSDGYTDTEIMNKLNVKRSTFYVYKARLFKVYGDIAAKKTEESLELEAEILKDRFTRLFRRLELKLNERDNELADLALGCETAAMIGLNILKLEVEGYRAREGKVLRLNEQKAIRCIGSLQSNEQQVSDVTDKATNATAAEESKATTATTTTTTDSNN